jgi:hypothetical protein
MLKSSRQPPPKRHGHNFSLANARRGRRARNPASLGRHSTPGKICATLSPPAAVFRTAQNATRVAENITRAGAFALIPQCSAPAEEGYSSPLNAAAPEVQIAAARANARMPCILRAKRSTARKHWIAAGCLRVPEGQRRMNPANSSNRSMRRFSQCLCLRCRAAMSAFSSRSLNLSPSMSAVCP